MQIQLNLDDNIGDYTIRSYQAGDIQVNDQHYQRSIIIGKQTLISDWRPQCYQQLEAQDLEPLLAIKAPIIIFGTGAQAHFLPVSLMQKFLVANIGIEVMTTAAACRTFNVLMSEDRDAIAALLVR